TTVLVFGVVNLIKLPLYTAAGALRPDMAPLIGALVPFALLGTWLGVRAHRAVPERAFFAVTYALLTLTGLRLVWEGLA
ncbi:MAG: TSUP family transporter, partial [Shimia sp.]